MRYNAKLDQLLRERVRLQTEVDEHHAKYLEHRRAAADRRTELDGVDRAIAELVNDREAKAS